MRQTELRLSRKDKQTVEEVRAKGLHHSREVNRAHILAALDRQVPQAQIMEVLGVEPRRWPARPRRRGSSAGPCCGWRKPPAPNLDWNKSAGRRFAGC